MMAEARTRRILVYFIIERKYQNFVELGVAQGGTMQYILNYEPSASCLKNYYAIDIWKEYHQKKTDNDYWEEKYNEILDLRSKYKQLKVFRDKTVNVAEKFEDHSVDMVFVDADHKYESVKEDILAWLPKIRLGGLMVGHDFHYGGVRSAVYEIFEEPIRTTTKRTWAIEVSRSYARNIKDEALRDRVINYG